MDTQKSQFSPDKWCHYSPRPSDSGSRMRDTVFQGQATLVFGFSMFWKWFDLFSTLGAKEEIITENDSSGLLLVSSPIWKFYLNIQEICKWITIYLRHEKELLKCTKKTLCASEKWFIWSMRKTLYAVLYIISLPTPYSIFAPSFSFFTDYRKRWLSWNSRGADSISTELQQATGTVRRLSGPTHVHHAGVCQRECLPEVHNDLVPDILICVTQDRLVCLVMLYWVGYISYITDIH